MTISDKEIIEMFREVKDPAFSAGECAERWGMSDTGARGRLNDLVEEGRLETKKPGHRTRVYWLSEESEDA